jgi:2-haloacid dehalogenase
MTVRAVVFDVGNVLYHWSPRALYEHLIPDDQMLDSFLRDVVTPEWHFQHDAGRDFAETSAVLIREFPEHEALINLWSERFSETITGPVAGMADLVAELNAGGVPLFGITNFSHEFWPPFRAKESGLFDCFQDILVSGVVKLAKPDPAIYAMALDRFGLAPGEAIFIDDSLANISSARACGLVGHHFVDSPTLRQELRSLDLMP